MLSVCICDDNPNAVEALRRIVDQYAFVNDLEINVDLFQEASALLEYPNRYSMIFLDIRFGEEDRGIDIATQLRAKGSESFIVFVSSLKDYTIRGYDVDALHFIVKPIDEQRVYSVLDKMVSRGKRDTDKIIVNTESGADIILVSQIAYIESHNRKRRIHCYGKKVETRETLTGLFELLPVGQFAYSHKAVIVNLDAVDCVHLDTVSVELESGKYINVPLSRRHKKSFSDALRGYLQNTR